MDDIVTQPLEHYGAAVRALSMLPTAVDDYRAVDDEILLLINDECTALEKRLGAARALIAGEIAHRSRAALGQNGLAQRNGHRTTQGFMKHTTGATKQQVGTALDAGALLAEMADEGRVDAATGEVQTRASVDAAGGHSSCRRHAFDFGIAVDPVRAGRADVCCHCRAA